MQSVGNLFMFGHTTIAFIYFCVLSIKHVTKWKTLDIILKIITVMVIGFGLYVFKKRKRNVN